jgi:adenine deaminase
MPLRNNVLKNIIEVARGQAPADLLLKHARIINVFTGEVEKGNVALSGGRIAGVGEYYKAKEVIDLDGQYLSPAFINGHTHIESSLLDIDRYASVVIPHGTLGVISDLHEIANVLGISGIRYILDRARRLSFDFFLMAPSCVPSSHLESSGARLEAGDIKKLLRLKKCLGLGEVMNYPGIIEGNQDILAKITIASKKLIDGHAPSLRGEKLNAYLSAGIYSDHESTGLAEAKEKLSRGMFIMIREGSSEKNLETILPLVNDYNERRFFFVVDDRNPMDLVEDGDIDAVVRHSIAIGLSSIKAIQMATINPAEYFGLRKMGAIAPGYQANLIVISDLINVTIDKVFYKARLTAEHGMMITNFGQAKNDIPPSMNIRPFPIEALRLKAKGESMPVIEIIPGQIVTRKVIEKVKTDDGMVISDTENDLLKLVVVERHHSTGNIGLGMVRGFNLKKGALVSSIAHDAHNIIAVGTNDADIYQGIKEVERIGGGLAVVADGKIEASLALSVAGLLSREPAKEVAKKYTRLERVASIFGSTLTSPFSTLSFLALPVIPEIRLTDLGLVDVNAFKIIS